jgi:hypothetical protein
MPEKQTALTPLSVLMWRPYRQEKLAGDLLSEYLGHANYETTKIYAYAGTEMKRLAVAKADALRDRMPPPVPLWADDEETIRILAGLR